MLLNAENYPEDFAMSTAETLNMEGLNQGNMLPEFCQTELIDLKIIKHLLLIFIY